MTRIVAGRGATTLGRRATGIPQVPGVIASGRIKDPGGAQGVALRSTPVDLGATTIEIAAGES